MNILLQFILFFFATTLSFYIPGKVILHFLQTKLTVWQEFILSWFLGLSFFILVSYLFAWIQMPYLVLGFIIYCLVYVLSKKILFPTGIKHVERFAVAIIVIGSLFFVSTTFLSGMETAKGLRLTGANAVDSIVYLAHIKNEVINFPPTHPGLSNVEFRGYHYFYDFLLSRFTLLYHFSPEDLLFRLFPFLVAILYGAGFFFIAASITKNIVKRNFVLFLAYFSQSFAFILPLVAHTDYAGAQTAQLAQPIGLLLDPSIVLGIALLLTSFGLFPKIRESFKFALIIGIMLGIVTQTKVYAGMIGISTLLIYSLVILIRERKYILNYVYTIAITGILTAITFLPNNLGVGHLTFAPFLIYRQYIQQPMFDSWHWEIQRIIFAEHHNSLRTIQLYLEAFAFFWLINLGIRILPILFIKRVFSKKFWFNDFHIIFCFAVLIPVILASLFIQSLSAFDIQQLLWIVLAIMSIPTGFLIGDFFVSRNKIAIGVITIFLCIGFVQAVYFVSPYVHLAYGDARYISRNDLQFYAKITKIVPKTDFIISVPPAPNVIPPVVNMIPVVSAMTGRSVYFEGEVIHYPLDAIYDQRQQNLKLLEQALFTCDMEMVNKEISIIHSQYLLTSVGNNCLANSSEIQTVISSDNMKFYQFK